MSLSGPAQNEDMLNQWLQRLRPVGDGLSSDGPSAEWRSALHGLAGSGSDEALDLLVEMSARAPESMLPEIAPMVETFLRQCPIERRPQLDGRLRRSWQRITGIYGDAESASESLTARWTAITATRSEIAVLAASHPNGYVRQWAVESLAEFQDSSALAALTLRLDDWVEPVSRAARAAWQDGLSRASPSWLLQLLSLLGRLEGRSRLDRELVRRTLTRSLSNPAARQSLWDALRLDSGRHGGSEGRHAFHWVLETTQGEERLPWLKLAIGHRDAVIRLWAFRAFMDGEGEGLARRHVEQGLEDPFLPVRSLALDACEERFPDLLEAAARRGLLDRSRSVRTRCQEILVMEFDVDPALIYRQALSEGSSRLAPALYGLSETGDGNDEHYFRAHLQNPSSRVRAAAVAGTAGSADADSATFFHLLGDPSPRVLRAAVSALTDLTWGVAQWAEAWDTLPALGRRALLHLVLRLGMLDRLILLLRAVADADPRTVELVEALLWHETRRARGLGAAPQTQDLERLFEALEAAAVSQALKDELRFMLKPWFPERWAAPSALPRKPMESLPSLKRLFGRL